MPEAIPGMEVTTWLSKHRWRRSAVAALNVPADPQRKSVFVPSRPTRCIRIVWDTSRKNPLIRKKCPRCLGFLCLKPWAKGFIPEQFFRGEKRAFSWSLKPLLYSGTLGRTILQAVFGREKDRQVRAEKMLRHGRSLFCRSLLRRGVLVPEDSQFRYFV